MKTIVLGYDDTVPAKRALERTAELARALEANVVVVSVAPVLTPAAHGMGPIDPADPPELHQEELVHARQLLNERRIEADYELAVGDPARAIVELGEERGADLIIVGREAGFLRRMLGESVSGAVERNAHCDVLIVH
jgi:nucleotide-binding universal stress UspA family protein